MQTFAEYLAAYRAKATVTASPALTNAETLALVKDENIKMHGAVVFYEYLGDDAAGDPVYRLGTTILLQDVAGQLAANVASGALSKIPGAKAAYDPNPSLRK